MHGGAQDSMPLLPPKKFCGTNDPQFIEERKEQLQEYIRHKYKLQGYPMALYLSILKLLFQLKLESVLTQQTTELVWPCRLFILLLCAMVP